MSIRLLLVRLPRLIADLTAEALTRRSDPPIDRIDTAPDLDTAVREAGTGVVVAAVTDPAVFAADCNRSVAGRQPVVLGITEDGREAWLLELRLRSLGQISSADLHRVVADSLRSRAS